MNDVITISDDTFRRGGRPVRHTGCRRLLGRVVRALQDRRPDPRRDRQRQQRQAQGREAERRRQPPHSAEVPGDEHPDAAALQERRGAGPDRGSEEQVADSVGVRASSLRIPLVLRIPLAADAARKWVDRHRAPPTFSYHVRDERSAARLVAMSRAWAEPQQEDLLPLRAGHVGDAVTDLQERLRRLGFDPGADAAGVFGSGTAQAVAGIPGPARPSWRRHLRPPDVVKPGRSGFSPRRPALVPPRTHAAGRRRRRGAAASERARVRSRRGRRGLRRQHPRGSRRVPAQCRPAHRRDLRPADTRGADACRAGAGRIGSRVRPCGSSSRWRRRRPLLSCKQIAVGEEGGFATGAAAVHRGLILAGARSLELHDPDPLAQAVAANTAKVDCYIGLRLEPEPRIRRNVLLPGLSLRVDCQPPARRTARRLRGHPARPRRMRGRTAWPTSSCDGRPCRPSCWSWAPQPGGDEDLAARRGRAGRPRAMARHEPGLELIHNLMHRLWINLDQQ